MCRRCWCLFSRPPPLAGGSAAASARAEAMTGQHRRASTLWHGYSSNMREMPPNHCSTSLSMAHSRPAAMSALRPLLEEERLIATVVRRSLRLRFVRSVLARPWIQQETTSARLFSENENRTRNRCNGSSHLHRSSASACRQLHRQPMAGRMHVAGRGQQP